MQNIAHTIVTTVYVEGTGTGLIRNTWKETALEVYESNPHPFLKGQYEQKNNLGIPEIKETADVTSLQPERHVMVTLRTLPGTERALAWKWGPQDAVLGGGFKDVLCSLLLGEMIQFD